MIDPEKLRFWAQSEADVFPDFQRAKVEAACMRMVTRTLRMASEQHSLAQLQRVLQSQADYELLNRDQEAQS